MVPSKPPIEVNALGKRIEFPFSCLLQSSFFLGRISQLRGEDEEICIRLGTCHMLGAGSYTINISSSHLLHTMAFSVSVIITFYR